MPPSILKNATSHHQSIKEHHETANKQQQQQQHQLKEKIDEKDEIENEGKITT